MTNLRKILEELCGMDETVKKDHIAYEQLNKDIDQAEQEIREITDKIADNCMYDFPKSYTNTQIIAFQKGIDKLWSAIHSAMVEKLEATNEERKQGCD